MAIIDSLMVWRNPDGDVCRVGDRGKTVVRDWPTETFNTATAEDFEENFFYMLEDPNGGGGTGHTGMIGEISQINVEPKLNKPIEDMVAGEAIAYVTGDLL